MSFDLRVICLGAGVQSSTMYRMSATGALDKADVAIFADTQQEPPSVYATLDLLEHDHGDVIPIRRTTVGDLGDHVERSTNTTGGRFASVPFWVKGQGGREAPGRRQCTREFKIDAIKQEIRRALGYKPGERVKHRVEEWVGISTDEASRAKPSRTPWITTRWPLLFDVPTRRAGCVSWLVDNGYPVPSKSACVFCPYRSAAEWARWRSDDPDLFETACEWDEKIRGGGRGMNGAQYVSRYLVPLRDVPDIADDQLNLFENECSGMCGI